MLAHSISTEDYLNYATERAREDGIFIGEQRGISIGKKLGEQRGKIEGMLLFGADVEEIAELTGASVDEIIQVRNNIEN